MNKALKLTAGLIAAGTIITATAPSISSFYNVSANELAKGNYSSSKATTLKQAEKKLFLKMVSILTNKHKKLLK
ncbi:MAG: hypothetical protein LKK24_07635 [Leuconostoc mesenteroides]|jgi:hypothetical protein|uniref:hypothetical protein n=1 Tax=Leuconostoc TaxID=1243 RepID=UPI000682FB80|nr:MULTISPECIES: hypothetical protein [Leuconostoc]KMY77441.1 hypothetical protein WZ79_07675 [Leuconostoc mesenteroides subsp. mesenteroides]MCH3953129.1 hypothetical protein [Leuconostoc mesenteroides]MCH3979167.1 hypothetical protein [Leuconostoc mesenteroides]MCI2090238.1 hypothetical protein [Leuconostoc mesenteroides]MCI2120938.1 hypothetical protein [Leuconostoc mesenteroides]